MLFSHNMHLLLNKSAGESFFTLTDSKLPYKYFTSNSRHYLSIYHKFSIIKILKPTGLYLFIHKLLTCLFIYKSTRFLSRKVDDLSLTNVNNSANFYSFDIFLNFIDSKSNLLFYYLYQLVVFSP